ncbi:MAG TPA: cytochrome c [Casimicrobiaceae bacterium]|nr:cytochrome c [Casimicrobiaceae bacterium]
MKHVLWIAGILFAAVGVAQAAGDAAAGKTKSGECTECHGAKGEGTEGPKLAGKSEAGLLQAMRDYKSGKREDATMKALMSKLSDQDMANLAAYYASLK